MKVDLSGKNAVVTGAGRGIGRAIALALAEAGANVAAVDVDEKTLNETAGDIEKLGRKALQMKVDVCDFAQVEEAVKKVADELGSIDVLVNNAGITRDGLLMRMPEKDWQAVLDVNLKGPFNFIKAAAMTMARQRAGSIINIASVTGIIGNAGQANYAASKGGLISLTKTVARELSTRTVRVNAVAPGFIETEMTAKLDEKVKEQLMAGVPLKRMGTPEDVASAVVFLASDLSAYITGQVLVVDGGMTM
ncbi:MAG: 3-oxoacyl-[acyl-carrier-protein] reductase [Planctomycetota bacterium]|jgi:3-oxoacyl-[acyl-carrier protein] reductase